MIIWEDKQTPPFPLLLGVCGPEVPGAGTTVFDWYNAQFFAAEEVQTSEKSLQWGQVAFTFPAPPGHYAGIQGIFVDSRLSPWYHGQGDKLT